MKIKSIVMFCLGVVLFLGLSSAQAAPEQEKGPVMLQKLTSNKSWNKFVPYLKQGGYGTRRSINQAGIKHLAWLDAKKMGLVSLLVPEKQNESAYGEEFMRQNPDYFVDSKGQLIRRMPYDKYQSLAQKGSFRAPIKTAKEMVSLLEMSTSKNISLLTSQLEAVNGKLAKSNGSVEGIKGDLDSVQQLSDMMWARLKAGEKLSNAQGNELKEALSVLASLKKQVSENAVAITGLQNGEIEAGIEREALRSETKRLGDLVGDNSTAITATNNRVSVVEASLSITNSLLTTQEDKLKGAIGETNSKLEYTQWIAGIAILILSVLVGWLVISNRKLKAVEVVSKPKSEQAVENKPVTKIVPKDDLGFTQGESIDQDENRKVKAA